MKVVGIGAQDDLTYAQNFVETTGTTFTMLWSDSMESWRHFDVRANSHVLLLDANGNAGGSSPGQFNSEQLSDQLLTVA